VPILTTDEIRSAYVAVSTLPQRCTGLSNCIFITFSWFGDIHQKWSIDPLKSLVILTSCLFTQALMGQGTGFKSALITALGLILLLRSDNYVVLGLAGSVAITSKFLFQAEGKHWFNPANFGIVCALLGSGQAWVSPGQWGQEGLYALLFLCLGGMILRKVGRWDTTASFLLVYVGLKLSEISGWAGK
jgi:Na+-transporting NADH:ubiquinone oxidoreductase subunit NqrB